MTKKSNLMAPLKGNSCFDCVDSRGKNVYVEGLSDKQGSHRAAVHRLNWKDGVDELKRKEACHKSTK